jgi:trans-aconitate methyltransferase
LGEKNVAEAAKWNAGLYDDKHSFVWKMASGVVELLEPKAGELILDLGCGTGHLTAKIAESGAHVTGVDRSLEMVRQARENHPMLEFTVMDAREIKLPAPVDAIFSNATLHWVKEPELVIAGVERGLKPGGRFVAEFGGRGNTATLTDALEDAWENVGMTGGAPMPWYYPSVGEYAGLLEKHGLEVTFATLFDRPTPLEDGERGLHNWLTMFGKALGEFSDDEREQMYSEIERLVKPKLFRDGVWTMDYRRLRVSAKRPALS